MFAVAADMNRRAVNDLFFHHEAQRIRDKFLRLRFIGFESGANSEGRRSYLQLLLAKSNIQFGLRKGAGAEC
ncbi:hypothetical protein HY30_06430 [Hyphomonas chukchiensis]|uniref:Uncharacterized protein n=1 Tax=Hyphomonas chukchiensis TaxID=1280947 RepID=A0A062UKW6_9PROT|nr:hypothetical protein HY30_06430 [Hyphomonas chukchiensis]